MKKYSGLIAVCIVMCILFSAFSTVTLAAEKEDIILVNEVFDDYPSNSIPEKISVSGEKGYRIAQDGEGNKSLLLPVCIRGSEVVFSMGKAQEEITVGFSIRKDSDKNVGISFALLEEASEHTLLSTKADGAVYAHNGKYITTISDKRYTDIQLVFSTLTSRYSVFVNGNAAAANLKYDTGIVSPLSFKIQTSILNDKLNIFLDNVRAHAGTDIKLQYPGKEYNHESYMWEDVPEEKGEIIFNDHYEKFPRNSLWSDDKDRYMRSFAKDDGGNTYLRIEQTQNDVFYMQYSDTAVLNNNRYITLEFDFMVPLPGAGGWIGYRDVNNVYSYLFNIDEKGGVSFAPNGKAIPQVNSKTWTKLSVMCDFVAKQCTLYVNGNIVYENVPMSSASKFEWNMRYLRFHMNACENTTAWGYDNLRIYTGKDRIPDEVFMSDITNPQPTFPDDTSAAIELLKNKNAIQLGSGAVYINNTKLIHENKPFVENNTAYIPSKTFAEILGVEAVWNDAEQSISFGDDVKVFAGTDRLIAGGKSYNMGNGCFTRNGVSYVPAVQLASLGFNKNARYYINWNFVIISDYEINHYQDDDIRIMSNFLLYDRPSAEKIKEDFYANGSEGLHPRLIAKKEDFERIKRDVNNSTIMKNWVETLMKNAETGMDNEIPEYPADGEVLGIARSTLSLMELLGFAYQLTGDKKYPECAWKHIEAVGTFKDWQPSSSLRPAEMCAAMAIAYDWMYDAWSDEQKSFIEEKVNKLGFDVMTSDYFNGGDSFATVETNWNVVCNGGLAMAALAMFEKNPELHSDILSWGIRGSEYLFDSGFAPSGSFGEGPNYWDYAVRYSVKYFASLDSALGTDYNVPSGTGYSLTGKFMIDGDSSVDVNNFHDSEYGHHNGSMFTYLGYKFNNPDIIAVKLKRNEIFGSQPEVYDPIFYRDLSITAKDIDFPYDAYYPGTEFVSMRNSWQSSMEQYFSFHAGELRMSHFHYDTGTFVYYALGEKWAVDLGRESLSYSTSIDSEKEKMYNMRAEAHNLVLINPDETGGLLNSTCPVETFVSKDRGAYSVVDLTDAYKNNVTSYKRGYMMGDERRSVKIRDEISLKKESDIYWFMNTEAQVEILDKNSAMLTINGKQMKLVINTNAREYELTTMPSVLLPTSPQDYAGKQDRKYAHITKVAIKIKASDKLNIEVKMMPAGDEAYCTALDNTPLSQWQIPDGPLAEAPKLDGINVEGMPYAEFEPDRFDYRLKPNSDGSAKQGIEAIGDGLVIEKTLNTKINQYDFKVYRKENPLAYNIYTVNLGVAHAGELEAYNRYKPTLIEASEVPQPQNPAEAVSDNKLETRWSASGNGQWIQLDLGEEKEIIAFVLAFMNGVERTYYYNIDISTDGVNYTPLISDGFSIGKDGYEITNLDNAVKARYIRYTGAGNSANAWNSVTEFGALGIKLD